uniref:nicotinamidase n=1 Tax=Parascaris equorum TaxID=6256 RepID=A0A914RCB8_PAREQ
LRVEVDSTRKCLQDGDGELNDVECEHVNQVLIEPLNRLRTALIVVDFQNDFVAGSMAIKNGSAAEDPAEALVPLNRLLVECPFTLIVYTMDWHPYNHISFWEHCRNSDRKLCAEDRVRKLKPFDVVRFEAPDVEQATAMRKIKVNFSTELEDVLRSEAIDAIFVCGLAYDVCVAATANDGVELGFLTALIADC